MRVERSEEQTELAGFVRSLVSRRDTEARTAAASERGFDEVLWTTLCEQIGVAALPVPEDHDGAGASLAESFVALEELGRTLSPTPLLGSVVAAAAVLDAPEGVRAELLPRIAAGEVCAVVLDDQPAEFADTADLLLRVGGRGVELVEPDGRTLAPAVDPLLRLARVSGGGREVSDAASAARARRVHTVGTACLASGLMDRALALTVEHTRERHQFGRPIGSFQALKHRMADLHVLSETSRSIARAAAYAVSDDDPEAARLADSAATWCADALGQVAGEMVQLHGGIAITWEHDAHLWFKRAHWLRTQLGQARRVASLAE